MEYLVAFQILCGGFAAFVARRKSRSALAWFAAGMLLPLLGVVLAVWVEPAPAPASERPARRVRRRIPKRCTGSYIPDCEGCPYFVRPPLFSSGEEPRKKGRCRHFGRDLFAPPERKESRVELKR